MKKVFFKALVLLGYCNPFVFLAMNEDAAMGTLWFYLIMIIGFAVLCCMSAKLKCVWIVFVGNILSFTSSCIFAWIFQTEKWEYYFKPFLPNQLIIFETVIALIIQILIVLKSVRRAKNVKKIH